MSIYNFSGLDHSGSGSVSASLVLINYTPGQQVGLANFVSLTWSGGVNTTGFTILASQLSGIPPQYLGGAVTDSFNVELLSMLESFTSTGSGWLVTNNGKTDYGGSGSWVYSGNSYYIAASGGSDSNPGTVLQPWATWNHSQQILQPGDTLNFLPGNYVVTGYDFSTSISGTAVNYITYAGATNYASLISQTGTFGHGVLVNNPYIRVTGFEITGPISVGAGIFPLSTHHVKQDNNLIHDFGGGGCGGVFSDYLTVEDNIVFNCSKVAANQTSGISLYACKAFDSASGYHNKILNNLSFSNSNPWDGVHSTTDGEGIIIDSNDMYSYTGATLIQGNICFNNGGRGIEIFNSSYVTSNQNICWGNSQDPHQANQGDIVCQVEKTSYNTFTNNIGRSSGAAGNSGLGAGGTESAYPTCITGSVWLYNDLSSDESQQALISGSTGFSWDPSNVIGTNPNLANPQRLTSYISYAQALLDFSPGSSPLGPGPSYALTELIAVLSGRNFTAVLPPRNFVARL